jgi:hypothetical protein
MITDMFAHTPVDASIAVVLSTGDGPISLR